MPPPRRGRRRWPRAGPRSRVARGRETQTAGAQATGAAAGGAEPAEAEARAGWVVALRARAEASVRGHGATREQGGTGGLAGTRLCVSRLRYIEL